MKRFNLKVTKALQLGLFTALLLAAAPANAEPIQLPPPDTTQEDFYDACVYLNEGANSNAESFCESTYSQVYEGPSASTENYED